jgi:hypothetical protein
LLFEGVGASGVAFSHDGSLLAANVENHIRVLNLQDRTELVLQDSESMELSCCRLEFSSLNYLANLSMPGELVVWGPDGQLAYCYESEDIQDFVFSNDGSKMYVNELGRNVQILQITD